MSACRDRIPIYSIAYWLMILDVMVGIYIVGAAPPRFRSREDQWKPRSGYGCESYRITEGMREVKVFQQGRSAGTCLSICARSISISSAIGECTTSRCVRRCLFREWGWVGSMQGRDLILLIPVSDVSTLRNENDVLIPVL